MTMHKFILMNWLSVKSDLVGHSPPSAGGSYDRSSSQFLRAVRSHVFRGSNKIGKDRIQ